MTPPGGESVTAFYRKAYCEAGDILGFYLGHAGYSWNAVENHDMKVSITTHGCYSLTVYKDTYISYKNSLF